MKRLKLIFGLGLMLNLVIGCNPIAKFIVGVKSPSEPNNRELDKWIKKSKIEDYPVYTLDTLFSELIDSNAHNMLSRKAYKQPLLILSFVNGKIISLNNNCNFPGLPTIHWNEFGTFNQFPPSSSYPDSTINIIKYKDVSERLVPFNNKAASIVAVNDTLLVIMVSKTYHRQSKALLKTIRSKYPEHKSKIIFVNNDSYIFHKINVGFQ